MFAGLARWIGFLTMIAIVGGLLLTGGFFWFATQISAEEMTLNARPTASWR